MKTIYVDNNATTPVAAEVYQAMIPFLTDEYFNPSSMYERARGPSDAITAARALITGGVDILQLRAKKTPKPEILALAKELAPLAAAAGVPFVINDFPEIAAACNAPGCHLGQDDGSLPETPITGRSTHSLEQAETAAAEGADYIGFGPLYATQTKPGRPPIGLEDIAEVHRRLPDGFPIFCIGGIDPKTTLPEVVAAGARRVVIVSALLQAKDIPAEIAEIKAQLPEI
jgi:thiamine-phosphate pyrophosphorylase